MAIKRYWKNTREYKRILEILDDYWLTEEEEFVVSIRMHFEKANGEYQDKIITWLNPNYEHDEDDEEIVCLADVPDISGEDTKARLMGCGLWVELAGYDGVRKVAVKKR